MDSNPQVIEKGPSRNAGWRQFLRIFRLSVRRDRASRIRALAHEAAGNPAGLAGWTLASDLWMGGDVAAAFRLAEKALKETPNDFRLILICLTYYIRARDSHQIYAFAERLIAADNPAPQLRLIYAVESLFLWPLWLLGSRRGRNIRRHADNLDRWVLWAKDYLATRPRPISDAGGTVEANYPPMKMPAADSAQPRRKAWSSRFIILLVLLIAFLVYLYALSVRKNSSVPVGVEARALHFGGLARNETVGGHSGMTSYRHFMARLGLSTQGRLSQ